MSPSISGLVTALSSAFLFVGLIAHKPNTPTSPGNIVIKGDASCQAATRDALNALKRAPRHYEMATKYIGVIECVPQGSGMFAADNPPRFAVGEATKNVGTLWYASGIAHEAGHSKLYHDYKINNKSSWVPAEIWSGEAAERICLEAQYDAMKQMGGSQAELDHIKNSINSRYFEVPYGDRWW